MLAAISPQGFMNWMVFEDNFTSKKCIEFLGRLIRQIKQQIFLILDNHRVHQMTENANNQIHSIEHHNKVMEQEMNDKIKEYEKAEISQSGNKAPQIPNKNIKN